MQKNISFCIFILYFIPAISIISCKEKGIFEKENNNSFSSSNIIEIGKTINGFVNTKNDSDYYKFEVSNNLILNIKLTAIKGVNHSFRIWKQEKNPVLLKWIDDNRKSSPEEIKNFHVKSGVYYIVVLHGERDPRKRNIETPYKLTATGRDPENEELEPNDKPADATQINNETIVAGYFSPSYNKLNFSKKNPFREEDWYLINVELNTQEPVLIDIYLSDVPGVDSELYLFDSEKKEIGNSRNSGPGKGEEIKNLGIIKSGIYYIMVTTKSYNQNINDQYTLNYSIKEYDLSNEMEVNNNFEKANILKSNNISGRIDTLDDIDYYLYNSEKTGSFYKIELISPNNLDLKMIIYNYKKNEVITVDNTKKGEIEIFPNIWLSGNFYISVMAKYHGNNKESSYDLSISRLEDSETIEVEPNDSKKNANKFNSNIITGYISKKGDKDFYLLEYSDRAKQKFEITGIKNGNINVMITDPHGYIIKTIGIKGDKTVSFTEMIDKKGYIIVEAVKENYNDKYKIILSEE